MRPSLLFSPCRWLTRPLTCQQTFISHGAQHKHMLIFSLFRGFKSAYSLDKIYPDLDQHLESSIQPPPVAEGLAFSGYIPMEQIKFIYSLSSGPGGQAVNKTRSRVQLRFHLDSAKWLSQQVKDAIKQKFSTRLTAEGDLILTSDRTRSQFMNRADVLDRLRFLVTESIRQPEPPSEEALERHRRLQERAARKRLLEKRERSHRKRDYSSD